MVAASVVPVLMLLATETAQAQTPSPALSQSPPRVFTNTSEVTALAAVAGTLWVGTRGGVEEYDLATLVRRRLYTTADGLAANEVVAVEAAGQGVVARTEKADCVRRGGGFACSSTAHAPTSALATALAAPAPALFAGARVTARLQLGARTFVGTAGQGLWLAGPRPVALTPGDQICSNHVVAVARFRGEVWLGTFDQGLCAFDGQAFRRARVPFRMINDLIATPRALFVASTRGLFRTTDGVHFQKVAALDGRGITDLALDGASETLWAVSPAALWQIPLGASGRLRGYYLPGGSRALQAVDTAGGTVWMASEDRGAIRLRHGQFQVFDRAAGLPSSWSVDVVANDDGGAYVATLRHGLVHLDADGRVQPAAQLPDRWLLHVSRDDRGALWVGTQGGAARLDDAGRPRTGVVAAVVERLPNPCVHAVATIGDETWFATEGGTAVYRRAQLPVPVGTNERSLVTSSLSSLVPSSR